MLTWTDFFQNPIWTFLSVIVAVVFGLLGIIIPYHLFFRDRKKTLSYQVLTDDTLTPTHIEAPDRIEILFDGKSVSDVTLLVIKIVNDGTLPISSSDFEQPLKITFEEKVEILSAEIKETSEKALKPIISFTKNQITINPILLNCGDNFFIKILITGYESVFEIQSRIFGVNDVEEFEPNTPFPIFVLMLSIFNGIVLTILFWATSLIGFLVMGILSLIWGLGLLTFRVVSPKAFFRFMRKPIFRS